MNYAQLETALHRLVGGPDHSWMQAPEVDAVREWCADNNDPVRTARAAEMRKMQSEPEIQQLQALKPILATYLGNRVLNGRLPPEHGGTGQPVTIRQAAEDAVNLGEPRLADAAGLYLDQLTVRKVGSDPGQRAEAFLG